MKKRFSLENFIGFARFASGDGFLFIFKEGERVYALSLTGRVFEVEAQGARFFIRVPYGDGRYTRAPIQFTL